ncbi:uncharacterized protein PAC_12365 [Phialocephala subalpina]|uniref:Uncharacterized protein n=1 Tax=Phialocephala subalpina TaxID=576137 RepID=A0A1L7XBR4_9HELO|nr:uncharacterized protein PAC_12365 [Phialocephala subalpina]
MFARAFPGRPPGRRPGKPGDPERPERPGKPGEGPPPPPFELTWAETVDGIQSMDDEDDEPDFSRGYLHIYRTTRPLTNLTIFLRNMTDGDDGPAFGDFRRGQDLCDLGAKWGIEGFVRMEMGFEIIFCEFSDGLVLKSARERPSGKNQSFERMRQLEVLRYPGITAQRLRLDYSGMVSAYWYDLNMTNPDPERADLPRLPASDVGGLGNMKADFMALFEESSSRSDVGVEVCGWEAVFSVEFLVDPAMKLCITKGAFYEVFVVFVVAQGLVEEAGSGELRGGEVLTGPAGDIVLRLEGRVDSEDVDENSDSGDCGGEGERVRVGERECEESRDTSGEKGFESSVREGLFSPTAVIDRVFGAIRSSFLILSLPLCGTVRHTTVPMSLSCETRAIMA